MGLNRRNALRAAAALGAAVPLAACDSPATWTPAPSPAGGTPPSTGPTSPNPSPTSSTLALPAEVVHGPRDRPNVALTFHGQGDPAMVTALLGELERGGARVTVLAVGSWLAAQPAMAKRILDGGHELGNHTQNHVGIAKLPAAKAYAEIEDCAAVLKRLTGSIGRWFRPSQIQYSTPQIRAQATKAGYPTCLAYDLDTLDYTDPGAGAVTHNTLTAVQNGSVVSMHCGHAQTVTAIPAILDGLRQRGLRAVTMTELMS